MKITDAHMHTGLAGLDARAIIRAMDRKGVDQCWLLSWEEHNPPLPQLYQSLPPEPIMEAYGKYPERLIPFYAPDPATRSVETHFAQYVNRGIKGCGELKVARNWDDPVIEKYLEMLQGYGMGLIIHMEQPYSWYIQEKEGFFRWIFERLVNDKYNGISRYYITRFADRTGIFRNRIRRNQVAFPGILYDFSAFEKRIRQFPAVRFVGHGPGFWNHISNIRHPRYIHQKGPVREFGIIDRLLEAYDNLYCDISGTSGFNAMKRDKAQSRIFLQKHAGKVLYGTDNTGHPLLELLHSLKPGQETLKQILYKNAEKVLGNS